MTAVLPKLNSGSIVDHFRPIWAGYYSAVEKIIGDGGIIVPILDPDHRLSTTTLEQRGHHASGVAATWTYGGGAPEGWDTPADLSDPTKYQGCIPILETNGTDEDLDTPDANYWNHGNQTSADEAFSVGGWFNGDFSQFIPTFSRRSENPVTEWEAKVTGNKIELRLFDNSSGNYEGKITDSATLIDNTWHHLVYTYDGTGGSSASGGITLYIDGVAPAQSVADAGTYSYMHDNGTSLTSIGSRSSGSFAAVKIAGGPLGPFHCDAKELNAQEVYRLYLLGRAALGLQ